MIDVYPVSVRGELDPDINRFMPLVKWLLAIPHLIILGAFGAIQLAIYVVAYVAILFTGRYPRGLFDFSLQMLRWEWRVAFYAYALGTDRYPPFSLSDDADSDYPAGINIEYPEQMSRLHLLLRFPLIVWLVVLPHLIVTYVLSIIGLVVLLLAVLAKLFTNNYPQGLFDFLLGVHRWNIRVSAYIELLTERYPPFSLSE